MNYNIHPEQELLSYGVDYSNPATPLSNLEYFNISNRIDLEWFINYTKIAKSTCCISSWKPEYFTIGLLGETGEVCDVIKRTIRGDYAVTDQLYIDALFKELGDVLWYCSMYLLYQVDDVFENDITPMFCDKVGLYIGQFNLDQHIATNNVIQTAYKMHNLINVPLSNYRVFTVLQLIDVIASQYGSSIKEIGEKNNKMLEDRKERNVLKGSGDDR